MSYIDVLIPLAFGLLIFLFPDSVLKSGDPSYSRKKANIKKIGIVLVLIGLIYLGIKFFETNY